MTEDEKRERREAAVKLLDGHVNQLSEHFDSVQIFCSRVIEGGEYTFGIQRGSGNTYAREGQVREWLTEQEQQARQNVKLGDNTQ